MDISIFTSNDWPKGIKQDSESLFILGIRTQKISKTILGTQMVFRYRQLTESNYQQSKCIPTHITIIRH